MTWLLNFLQLVEALTSTIDKIWERAGIWLSDLWDAFPNPVKMAEVTIAFFTGLLGMFLAAVGTQTMRAARTLVEKRTKGKLAKPGDVLKWIEDSLGDSLKQITLTSEQGLIEWCIQRLSIFLWGLFKQFKLIRSIIGIKELADVVKIVQSFFRYRAAVLTIVVAVAFVAFLLMVAFHVTAAVLILYEESVLKACLPQDSRRMRKNFRRKEVRVNLRRGPDFPVEK